MRILHVIPSLKKGGAERLCLDMVSELKRNTEHDVVLATLTDHNDYRQDYPQHVPVVTHAKVIPSITGKWTIELNAWFDLINEFNPDVVHSHLFEAEMVSRYQPIVGIRYFTHCHDNMPQLKRLSKKDLFSKKRLTQAYERHFLMKQYNRCSNQFLVISPDTEAYFRNNLPESMQQHVHLFPNAIDHRRFSQESAAPPSVGSKLKLMNIGSFVSKKNQKFLLHVVRHLIDKGIDTTLTLAGDGPLKNTLRTEAKSLGVERQVHFLGNVNNVEQVLWKSHVYVHGATYEPFGLVILEAMAAGLPVVALDGRGNRELHRNGKTGFLVLEQDVETFADRILDCSKDESTWLGMSEAAKDFAAHFNMENYVQKLSAIYAQASI